MLHFGGMKTAVIGGGNSALEAIIDLLKIAEEVSSISEWVLPAMQFW